MDAILTGIGTVVADDPRLTARPSGPRTATRIVLDSQCRLSSDSQLVRTATEVPVLVVTTASAPVERIESLKKSGVEVLVATCTPQGHPDLHELVRELGRRRMTNVLLEAGGTVLGSFFDARLVNEVHAFVAPVLVGGLKASSPVAGTGVDPMANAWHLDQPRIQVLAGDVYVNGFIATTSE